MATELASAAPPEPKRFTVRLERGLDRLHVVSVKRQWASAAFLILWLTIWTFGCIMLAGMVIAQPSVFTLLFAVPFWAAELFVFSLVGTMIASREEVVLDAEGLAYCWTVWRLPVSRRRVPLAEIVRIDDTFVPERGKDKEIGNVTMTGHRLIVETIGQPLQLPGGSNEEEQAWLAHVFNETLAGIKRFHQPIERAGGSEPTALPSPDELPDVLELRPPAAAAVSPPSDTTWQYAYDFNTITFCERGRLSLGALGFLLFINGFWNGITSLFVLQLWGFGPPGQKAPAPPYGWDWWGMFLFLLPFEIIGLVMFSILVGVLAEPFRRSRWMLDRNAITYRLSYLGIGRAWRYEIRELDRLELRRSGGKNDPAIDDPDDDDEDDEEDDADATDASGGNGHRVTGADHRFHLAFVDRHGKDVCQIENLGLGEACWMADVVLRERKGWFR